MREEVGTAWGGVGGGLKIVLLLVKTKDCGTVSAGWEGGGPALLGPGPNSLSLSPLPPPPPGSWSCHLCLRHLKEKASAYITLT